MGKDFCGLPELGTAVERREVSCISCTWLRPAIPGRGIDGAWVNKYRRMMELAGIDGRLCQSGKGTRSKHHHQHRGPHARGETRERLVQKPSRPHHHADQRGTALPIMATVVLGVPLVAKTKTPPWAVACSRTILGWRCRRLLLVPFSLSQCRVSRCKKDSQEHLPRTIPLR